VFLGTSEREKGSSPKALLYETPGRGVAGYCDHAKAGRKRSQ